MQVIEGVVSVVACLDEAGQASTSRTLLEPVLQALQQQLQQLQQQQPQHANGAGPSQSPEGFEVISALMDRLGILFRWALDERFKFPCLAVLIVLCIVETHTVR